MSKNILFVFEGERTEIQITENLKKYFQIAKNAIQCAYCSDIYKLYEQINKDDDLDTFMLLKELEINFEALSAYKRYDFAEIYLFFDYDGHATMADDNKIINMLRIFQDETAAGKLYISYPMVEALKHHPEDSDFKHLKVAAKDTIQYKYKVSIESRKELIQFKKYNSTIWKELIELHLKKMNFITKDEYCLPIATISQYEIFIKQLEKYIEVDLTVAVLSSFPVFLFDYYGNLKFYLIITEESSHN
jgi:hypothetical protein